MTSDGNRQKPEAGRQIDVDAVWANGDRTAAWEMLWQKLISEVKGELDDTIDEYGRSDD